jgi:hypothetical protein
MYENSFGVPEMLPAGYGGAQAEPATLRMNALPKSAPAVSQHQPRVVHNNNTAHRPMSYGAQSAPNYGPVVRLSDIEKAAEARDESEEYEITEEYGYEYASGYGGFGAAASGPSVVEDKTLKLKYREYKPDSKYTYRQYSNGSYAITVGNLPKGITRGKPFTAAANSAAFAAIKKQVEAAIGAFPVGVTPTKPGAKKTKKTKKKGKAPKIDAGKILQKGLEAAGKVGAKFEASGAATAAKAEPETEAETPGSGEGESESFFTKKFYGVPTWGWIAGAVVVAGGVYAVTRSSKAVPVAALPVAPPPVAVAPRPRQLEAAPVAARRSAPVASVAAPVAEEDQEVQE